MVLTVIMFALFAVAGLLVKFPDKGDDLMVQLAKGQLFSEEGIYTGKVVFVEGDLEQRVPKGGGWKKLAQGEQFLPGMEIRTLADSKAIIEFDERTALLMSEVTQITFENKLYQIDVELVNGFIFNKIDLVASRKYNINVNDYRIEATNANFAVRKEFQGNPEVLVLREKIDLFIDKEKKNTFNKGRKVGLRVEEIEEMEISADDYAREEMIWGLKESEKK